MNDAGSKMHISLVSVVIEDGAKKTYDYHACLTFSL